MNFPEIKIQIEDRVYRVDASNGPAIQRIPKQDREHLSTLLLAIRKQEQLAAEQGAEVEDSPAPSEKVSPRGQLVSEGRQELAKQIPTSSRPAEEQQASADVDQIMNRLIAEEKRGSGKISKVKMYMISGSVAALVLLLLSALV